ncbi:hypothetical protein Cantr_06498 [Candida viswanathii]|uniref:Uncharacterized protein n=1 Tax=Candida viswanathii TaxID=5486 RepID=A0A367XUN6_9ASCO|nr:hypothetical protein Cantr_06498 [Candida viswanathii]
MPKRRQCQQHHVPVDEDDLCHNTLMSKLTKAYNLFQGLDDPIINTRISHEWLPYTTLGKMLEYRDEEETRIYEEEFLGDFLKATWLHCCLSSQTWRRRSLGRSTKGCCR